ncbi:MAG: hypothetical protein JRJ62_01565 [Deltaproteobacteria bacterium]|nr:hypothetical protein [Deltaproteobacteria bacterium]
MAIITVDDLKSLTGIDDIGNSTYATNLIAMIESMMNNYAGKTLTSSDNGMQIVCALEWLRARNYAHQFMSGKDKTLPPYELSPLTKSAIDSISDKKKGIFYSTSF